MRRSILLLAILPAGFLGTVPSGFAGDRPKWDPAKAALRLDERASLWKTNPETKRSHDTSCISCHSATPYLLARPLLRGLLDESEWPGPEKLLLADVERRVSSWSEVEPWYAHTEEKVRQSRGTEAVLNALVLAFRDRAEARPKATDRTRRALEILWGEQQQDGGFAWLFFDLAPWETEQSEFFGACLAGVAASTAPGYAAEASARAPIARLADYLRSRPRASLNLHSRAGLLWVSSLWEGLLSPAEQGELASALVGVEQESGGFRLRDLGDWNRKKDTPDAYATGLVVLALGRLPDPRSRAAVERGRAWLASHQDADGRWTAESPNVDRSKSGDFVRGFMSDAASAYAVLALAER